VRAVAWAVDRGGEDGIWRARDGSDSGLAAPNQPLALSRGGEGRRKEKVRREGRPKERRRANTSSPCVHLEAVSPPSLRLPTSRPLNGSTIFFFSVVFLSY
jgi:hypothetical protein